MKRKITSLLLVVAMIIAVFPMHAFAWTTAVNTELTNPKRTSDDKLYSFTLEFDWGSAGIPSNGYLLLMNKPLTGSSSDYGSGYGQFTDQGSIADDNNFSTVWDVVAYDKQTNEYGIIKVSQQLNIKSSDNKVIFAGLEDAIQLSEDNDTLYYIYLWVTYRGKFYPDNVLCVMQVKNKEIVQYAVAKDQDTYRNEYDLSSMTELRIPPADDVFDVDIYSGANSSHVASSGALNQHSLTGAMKEVVFSAKNGYNFPNAGSTNTRNGITLEVSADGKTVKVYGTPTAHTSFTIPDATKTTNNPTHNHTLKYNWNDKNHWGVTQCSIADCPEKGNISNEAPHRFDNAQDTTCDCGYVRNIPGGEDPAAKPNTGDITNIPLWTMLLMVGAAAMYLQLTQRKREEF